MIGWKQELAFDVRLPSKSSAGVLEQFSPLCALWTLCEIPVLSLFQSVRRGPADTDSQPVTRDP